MKKSFYQNVILTVFTVFCFSNLYSQSTFQGLDLNSINTLIFSQEKFSSANESYNNLYAAELQKSSDKNPVSKKQALNGNLVLTTCYPQKIDVLLDGTVLEIRNSEGTARYYSETSSLKWTTRNNLESNSYFSTKTEVSPNGKWVVYYEKNSAASGKIILEEVSTGKTIVLSDKAEFSFSSIPVKWSSDSSFLIYEKNENLFFLDIKEAFNSNSLAESFRKIGKGTINNINWANEKLIVYIYNDMIYKITTNELYTRSLYADMVGNGKISGCLPNSLNSETDSFWVNSDGNKIVLIQNSTLLWYMELQGKDYGYAKTLFTYPLVDIAKDAMSFKVFWTPENKGIQNPYIWIEVLKYGKIESFLHKLTKDPLNNTIAFETIKLPEGATSPKVSPDGKFLSFNSSSSLYVYDIYTWKHLGNFSKEEVISYEWANNKGIYIGGKETVAYWEPFSEVFQVLFLSQAKNYGFDLSGEKIVAKTSHDSFAYNKEQNIWEKTDLVIRNAKIVQNPYWRVFLSSTKNSNFTNGIYVRTLTGLSETRPLISDFSQSTIDSNEIALVFDCLDNADGLSYVLNVLSKYNIKATFFINGEFIRRYPSLVKEIVKNNHECGSMFFTTADLTSNNYIVDEEFVRRGLARTEDEFFALTGSELSLYWHTPYYKTTKAIISGGKQAGYTLVVPTTKQLDMQTLEDTAKNSTTYYSSAKIIEGIFSVLRDRAIIPVSVGLSDGTRTDYLYNKIDVLISAIIEKGYKIVPISELDF